MIIDLTGSVSFAQNNESCDEVNDEDSRAAHWTWREWVREKYGPVAYPDLDEVAAIIVNALLDDRMRDILKICTRKSIRAEISFIVCEYERGYISAQAAAWRISVADYPEQKIKETSCDRT